jgi:DNA-binding LytR/AlgR family response regulator
MTLRLLIADDEPALRDWLKRLLAELAPRAEIVAEAADGTRALADIERLSPDVAFLDIRMPGLSGLEVAARISVPCRVVFVTAFDEFALQAFDQAALDYLVKPVTKERLARTLERLQVSAPPGGDGQALLNQLLARLSPAAPSLRWLRVGSGDVVQLLDVAEVDHFQAADKYTLVHVGVREWLMRMSLKELEEQLDPQAFWRVHRSGLVRVAAIAQVQRDLLGRLWLHLKSGAKPLPVSRSYAHLFRQM